MVISWRFAYRVLFRDFLAGFLEISSEISAWWCSGDLLGEFYLEICLKICVEISLEDFRRSVRIFPWRFSGDQKDLAEQELVTLYITGRSYGPINFWPPKNKDFFDPL